MNDRHPSGTAHYAAYDGYSTTSFANDPLFGDLQGDDDPYDTGSYDTSTYSTGSYETGTYGTGSYDTSTYDTGSYETGTYGNGTYETATYDTGQWSTDPGQHQYAPAPAPAPAPAHPHTEPGYGGSYGGAWHEQLGAIPAQGGAAAAEQYPGHEQQTGQWDTAAYATQTDATRTFEVQDFGATEFDSGAYDATQWNSAGGDTGPAAPGVIAPEPVADPEPEPEPAPAPASAPVPRTTRAASRGRGRRRTPARRSALLSVAVPSVCVVGVAGIAAAAVGVGGGDDGKDAQAAAAPDPTAVRPSAANNKLDTQLRGLSAGADDFADRASRTQERIDLKAKEEADRKKAAAEARRKEALRPKYALPVKQHGLSAYFGQAGINWMSVHTGIDFPVSYGTPVMAATDGTVATKWNSAYGNMLILTRKDGTQTWYCHLSSYVVSSGPVKAGEVIAHSGNSGNSTGPHLHFEVHPHEGAAVDPLPWLRSHGLNPT
ncbi:M23 family metallopeptidase [Streptomyces beihaiensis]|uniref:M23 family metallopeptidase n=1 Tax=Streptomyces beihaiensis TaxID=2984495 RepID=A0ABT3TMT7_9ACTN|nr:M23 family metallopeptidase [Streptomyces beihaiensis]MCX3058355.1 M23 family metallopeptidase [Streptomyces beihaiensis]